MNRNEREWPLNTREIPRDRWFQTGRVTASVTEGQTWRSLHDELFNAGVIILVLNDQEEPVRAFEIA